MRIELGKNDFAKQEVRIVRRDNGEKSQQKWTDLVANVPGLLDTIHEDMYQRAAKSRDDHMIRTDNWKDFMTALNSKNICLAPWCDEI